MEINSIPSQIPLAAPQASAAPGAKETTFLPKAQTVQDAPKSQKTDDKPNNNNGQATDEERFEMVKNSAQSYKNSYAVSDTTFTIFKDSSGQYVTRFTNLRDGKVTYIPEPEILQYLETMGNHREALVKIEA